MYDRRLRCACAALLLLPLTRSALAAQAGLDDRRAVERAVLEYVEGFYEGDTAKLVRRVHPQVNKYGYWIPRDGRWMIRQVLWQIRRVGG